jgi:DHA2 family multidrug resistance protein
MTVAALSSPRSTAAGNPWLVAAVVVVPTFMEVLDTTIAVVALRYIAGGLSATVEDGEWVLTSYLAANAIILPITGWLSAHLGRRNYFLLSIAVFTIASALCGLAGSLSQLILFRVIQGLAGGGLQPSSQGVLLDAFPVEKQGVAMTLFGFAALIAPVVGPTLGGWLTDTYSWRWVFLINVPVGLLAFIGCYALLRDPAYLTTQRTELKKRPFHFDSIGLSLLVIVMVSWEVMLSKGQEWDWLGDPFWRVQTLATFFVVGLIILVFWELQHRNPVVNFRPLREHNFAGCCIIIFGAYLALYGASTSLPGLLQSLFGYDALRAGLVMSPAGVFAVLAMPVVGRLLGRGTDARWLIGAGLLVMTAGNYWMSQLNLDVSPGQLIWPRVLGGPGIIGLFCAGKCRSLPLYTVGIARRGGRLVEPAAQRGGQRRNLGSADLSGAARTIPRSALGGIPRSLQRGRELLRRACSGVLLPRNRRSGRSTAARFAGTRKSAAAASIRARLLRLLLDVCGVDLCARIRGSDHEAIGG